MKFLYNSQKKEQIGQKTWRIVTTTLRDSDHARMTKMTMCREVCEWDNEWSDQTESDEGPNEAQHTEREEIGAHLNVHITWLQWLASASTSAATANKKTEYISASIWRIFFCYFRLTFFNLPLSSKPSQLNLRFHRLLWFCAIFSLSLSFFFALRTFFSLSSVFSFHLFVGLLLPVFNCTV